MPKSLLVAVLFAIGCGTSVQVTRLNWAGSRPARPPEAVEVFSSGPPRDRTYIDVAFMEAEQEEFSGDNTGQFLHKLRTIAGRMGCDALVIGGTTNAARSAILDSNTTVNHKGLTATCIAYTDVPPGGQLPTTISRAAPPR